MTAEAALYQMFLVQLSGGVPVYADIAPASAAYPFIVFSVAAGGETNNRGDRDDADFRVTVKCLGLNSPSAYTGASYIQSRLNDRGTQDRKPLSVSNSHWQIKTITASENISLIEQYENASWIYHRGMIYDVIMEAINGNV